jgi:hypothetical protein
MWKAAKGLLSSKKALMAFISAGVWALGKAGLDMDTETLAGIVSPLWVYIFGQGIADHGKGKEEKKIEGAEKAALAAPAPAAPVDEDEDEDTDPA